MPLTSPDAALRKLQRSMNQLVTGPALLRGVQGEVKKLLADEFRSSVGPDGAAWQQTVRGTPALVSRKLANVFTSEIAARAVSFHGRLDWLEAHQEGHTFAARAAGGQALIFGRDGKLVRSSAVKKQSFVFDRTARPHQVGKRVLPQRQIYPAGLTPRWESAIGRGLAVGMERWRQSAER